MGLGWNSGPGATRQGHSPSRPLRSACHPLHLGAYVASVGSSIWQCVVVALVTNLCPLEGAPLETDLGLEREDGLETGEARGWGTLRMV
ncbi:hypothetical protein GGTG_00086 [Gaeumannomyces tritici R3-111a-1]|uniref:Uncharacterized protein n=1 Tax=Gaeumannomyces tritici (strain R3-111a-1) TaxID=644352 RepID=J3NFP1_GAET3|nr:hypothetical protein GGTG_00086 [Gaeumannomyces tritici R3-111a-1]EJT80081.1 hypothetical protein GGTG_00086 [Gaeumannomyces tritici R3-111a-1]